MFHYANYFVWVRTYLPPFHFLFVSNFLLMNMSLSFLVSANKMKMEKLSTDEIAVELLLSYVTSDDENLEEKDFQMIQPKHLFQCDILNKVISDDVDVFMKE
jgi:hypothetical protein